VTLVDPESGQYYYPLGTDLRGEVLSGRPRVGIVVFQPVRATTNCLEAHFNATWSSGAAEAQSFSIAHRSDELLQVSTYLVNLPSLSQRLVEALYGPGVELSDVLAGNVLPPSATTSPEVPSGLGGQGATSGQVPANQGQRAVQKPGGCGCVTLTTLALLVLVGLVLAVS